jgi:hypothetical protein
MKIAMTMQEQLWQAAWIIAEQYGDEAVGFATQMAESFEAGGRQGERDLWLSIKDKVSALTAEDAGSPIFWQ